MLQPGSAPCAGTSNLIRGICLALGATFLGCALTFTIPDAIANALNVAMPVWFYESEVSLMPAWLDVPPILLCCADGLLHPT